MGPQDKRAPYSRLFELTREPGRQLTLSVKLKVCVVVPLLAVTVMIWLVATGVPGLVGPVPPPPPPLPPHAAMTINNGRVIPAAIKFQRRRRA